MSRHDYRPQDRAGGRGDRGDRGGDGGGRDFRQGPAPNPNLAPVVDATVAPTAGQFDSTANQQLLGLIRNTHWVQNMPLHSVVATLGRAATEVEQLLLLQRLYYAIPLRDPVPPELSALLSSMFLPTSPFLAAFHPSPSHDAFGHPYPATRVALALLFESACLADRQTALPTLYPALSTFLLDPHPAVQKRVITVATHLLPHALYALSVASGGAASKYRAMKRAQIRQDRIEEFGVDDLVLAGEINASQIAETEAAKVSAQQFAIQPAMLTLWQHISTVVGIISRIAIETTDMTVRSAAIAFLSHVARMCVDPRPSSDLPDVDVPRDLEPAESFTANWAAWEGSLRTDTEGADCVADSEDFVHDREDAAVARGETVVRRVTLRDFLFFGPCPVTTSTVSELGVQAVNTISALLLGLISTNSPLYAAAASSAGGSLRAVCLAAGSMIHSRPILVRALLPPLIRVSAVIATTANINHSTFQEFTGTSKFNALPLSNFDIAKVLHAVRLAFTSLDNARALAPSASFTIRLLMRAVGLDMAGRHMPLPPRPTALGTSSSLAGASGVNGTQQDKTGGPVGARRLTGPNLPRHLAPPGDPTIVREFARMGEILPQEAIATMVLRGLVRNPLPLFPPLQPNEGVPLPPIMRATETEDPNKPAPRFPQDLVTFLGLFPFQPKKPTETAVTVAPSEHLAQLDAPKIKVVALPPPKALSMARSAVVRILSQPTEELVTQSGSRFMRNILLARLAVHPLPLGIRATQDIVSETKERFPRLTNVVNEAFKAISNVIEANRISRAFLRSGDDIHSDDDDDGGGNKDESGIKDDEVDPDMGDDGNTGAKMKKGRGGRTQGKRTRSQVDGSMDDGEEEKEEEEEETGKKKGRGGKKTAKGTATTTTTEGPAKKRRRTASHKDPDVQEDGDDKLPPLTDKTELKHELVIPPPLISGHPHLLRRHALFDYISATPGQRMDLAIRYLYVLLDAENTVPAFVCEPEPIIPDDQIDTNQSSTTEQTNQGKEEGVTDKTGEQKEGSGAQSTKQEVDVKHSTTQSTSTHDDNKTDDWDNKSLTETVKKATENRLKMLEAAREKVRAKRKEGDDEDVDETEAMSVMSENEKEEYKRAKETEVAALGALRHAETIVLAVKRSRLSINESSSVSSSSSSSSGISSVMAPVASKDRLGAYVLSLIRTLGDESLVNQLDTLFPASTLNLLNNTPSLTSLLLSPSPSSATSTSTSTQLESERIALDALALARKMDAPTLTNAPSTSSTTMNDEEAEQEGPSDEQSSNPSTTEIGASSSSSSLLPLVSPTTHRTLFGTTPLSVPLIPSGYPVYEDQLLSFLALLISDLAQYSRLVSSLLIEAPLLPPSVFAVIFLGLCYSDDPLRIKAGLEILRDLVRNRPAHRKLALSLLIASCLCSRDKLRKPALRILFVDLLSDHFVQLSLIPMVVRRLGHISARSYLNDLPPLVEPPAIQELERATMIAQKKLDSLLDALMVAHAEQLEIEDDDEDMGVDDSNAGNNSNTNPNSNGEGEEPQLNSQAVDGKPPGKTPKPQVTLDDVLTEKERLQRMLLEKQVASLKTRLTRAQTVYKEEAEKRIKERKDIMARNLEFILDLCAKKPSNFASILTLQSPSPFFTSSLVQALPDFVSQLPFADPKIPRTPLTFNLENDLAIACEAAEGPALSIVLPLFDLLTGVKFDFSSPATALAQQQKAYPTRPLSDRFARAAWKIYANQRQDPRLLVPLLPNMRKEQFLRNLPRLVTVPPALLTIALSRLLNMPESPVTPTELLAALHRPDVVASVGNDVIIDNAVTHLLSQSGKFSPNHELLVALSQIMLGEPLPPVVMNTFLRILTLWPTMSNDVVQILNGHTLRTPKWAHDPHVWEGFVRVCKLIGPTSYEALLRTQSKQLQGTLTQHPDLAAQLIAYAQRNPYAARKHLPLLIQDQALLTKLQQEQLAQHQQARAQAVKGRLLPPGAAPIPPLPFATHNPAVSNIAPPPILAPPVSVPAFVPPLPPPPQGLRPAPRP